MKATNKYTAVELSYFHLSLLLYLLDSHFDCAADRAFIAARGDAAAEAYSEAVRSGHTHNEADEIASQILYSGLHFSPFNTLVNILWDEFAEMVRADEARAVALKILPSCADVLAKYTLTDDFADSLEYDLLYTELVGTVQILIEDGLQ